MPTIRDNELVGDKADESYAYPAVPLGIMIEQTIQRNLEEHGDIPAMTDVLTGRTISYSDLLKNIRSVSSALRKRGLKDGDVVAAIGNNYLDYVIFGLAVWRAGGVLGTLIPTLLPSDYTSRLKEMDAKFVLADPESIQKVVEGASKLDCIIEIFSVSKTNDLTTVAELMEDSGDECPESFIASLDSMTWLAFTSGTTGRAKAVNHSHNSLGGFMIDNRTPYKVAGRTLFFINPFNNGAGLMAVITSILDCVSIYLLATYNEEDLLKTIHRFRPQAVSVFPAHLAYICRHLQLDQYDLSSVLSLTSTGSMLHPKYERDAYDIFPNLKHVKVIYGMTEFGVATSNSLSLTELVALNTKEKAIERHVIGSVGKVHRYVKVKILDEVTKEKLGSMCVGEIYVKSPFACSNYLNNIKASQEFFTEDGWARSGDKAYYDDNGNLFIVGRYKELIKYRNIHVVPSDIEEHLMTHPNVEDVGVIGVPQEVDGEWPMAFVKLRHGSCVTAEELIEFNNSKITLDAEKLRGGIRFVDHVPRNTMGKIVRHQLTSWL